MSPRAVARAVTGAAVGPAGLLLGGAVRATAETPYQLTWPLIEVMTALSVVGAAITFYFLVYAIWKFRDPRMRGRRHG